MKKAYLIIVSKGDDQFKKKIKSYREWCIITNSSGCVISTSDIETMYNDFKSIVGNDQLFIIEINKYNTKQGWLDQSIWNWFKRYLPEVDISDKVEDINKIIDKVEDDKPKVPSEDEKNFNLLSEILQGFNNE